MFCVYILKSLKKDKYYVGQTNNLEDWLKRHNNGRSVYTKQYMPWELVYKEEFENRHDALMREKEIKSWKSVKAIAQLIERPD